MKERLCDTRWHKEAETVSYRHSQNHHKKFGQETKRKISHSAFCKMRPFWILQPRIQDRETFLCIRHDNMLFLVDKINFLSITKTANMPITNNVHMANVTVVRKRRYQSCLMLIQVFLHFTTNGQHKSQLVLAH